MGRIRKYKLSWKPLESNLVVNNRLYWSSEGLVTYSSNFIDLGNCSEVNLPDALKDWVPLEGAIFLGISVVDKVGNESDIVCLPEPCFFSVPPAPVDLALTRLDNFNITESKKTVPTQVQDREKLATQKTDLASQQNPPKPSMMKITTEGRIVKDFDVSVRQRLGLSD